MYKHDINICCFWYADQCYGFWIFVLITKIFFYSQMRDIQKSLKSIWNRPYIIWRLQSWWIWCFWSCQSFTNQSSNELHRFIIIEFHRSNRNWSCNRREKSDLGWVFAFWINNECCRSCHRHCRLSRSSCSWHTLYKVNHLLFFNNQRLISVFLVNLFWMMVLPLYYFKFSNLLFILVLVQSLPQIFIDHFSNFQSLLAVVPLSDFYLAILDPLYFAVSQNYICRKSPPRKWVTHSLLKLLVRQKNVSTSIVWCGRKLQNNDRLIKPLNDLSIRWWW